MRVLAATPWLRVLGFLALALGALSWAGGAYAGDRHRAHERHGYEHKHKQHHSRHAHHHHRGRSVKHRHKHVKARPAHRPGWHYHAGRYWAPPNYRGRYCTDHRHYRGAHYHVAVRDYYDYYYPRYRYYGSPPSTKHASLIITVPLF